MVNQRPRLFFRLLLVAGCCALIPSTVPAQLGGKPYQQWTAKEAEGLLTNSPWAQTLPGLVAVGRRDPLIATVDTTVTVRLHSALPVRQALVRLRQLKARYDQKSDRDKAAIDAKNRPLLECPECADYYVVVMGPGPGSRNGLPTALQTAPLAWVKLNVQIKNEKGETRELVKFARPKFAEDDVVFFFSRFDSKGEPLISPANHTLTISFDPGIFAWKKPTLTKFEFDVARMIVNGQVVF
jgi:hypothetical protein